jgi:hypothetical protein
VLTLSEGLDDESKAQEGEEDAIQLLESGEDTTIALEPSKETLDFVALPVTSRRLPGRSIKNTLPGRVRFGAFQLDLIAGELHKDDRRVWPRCGDLYTFPVSGAATIKPSRAARSFHVCAMISPLRAGRYRGERQRLA